MYIRPDHDAKVGETANGAYYLRRATKGEYRENRIKRLTRRLELLREEMAEAESELRALGALEGS